MVDNSVSNLMRVNDNSANHSGLYDSAMSLEDQPQHPPKHHAKGKSH